MSIWTFLAWSGATLLVAFVASAVIAGIVEAIRNPRRKP